MFLNEEDNDGMDFWEIISILRKWNILILIAPIIFAIIGALISIYLIKPVYESSTTIIIRQNKFLNEQIDKSDVDLSKSLIYTYAEMAKSNTVLENTKQKLNLDDFDKELITVSPVKDTQILKISVLNSNPELATEIANTLVNEFTYEIIRITKSDNVAVVDYATIPDRPVKPNKVLNVAISAILGEMTLIFIIFIIEYLNNTIKNEKDIKKYLELPVIGSVPNFNQGGKNAKG